MPGKFMCRNNSCLFSLFTLTLMLVSPMLWARQFNKDTVVIESLFSHSKPQCVGRYLIDVPQSFENQLRDMVFIDDFKIESRPLYRPAFEQRVERRKNELENAINMPGNDPKDVPFIKETIQLANSKGVIFDRNKNGSDDSFRALEAHVYTDKIAFIITVKILDLSAKKYEQERLSYIKAGFTLEKTNDKPDKLVALRSLISRLSGRKDDELPTGKGVCIPNGFIADDGRIHEEKISFSYKNDDFIFKLFTDNTEKGSSDTLFNRSAEIEDSLKQSSDEYSIGKKAFSPGGIPVQQWLFGGKRSVNREMEARKEKVPVYDFMLYANEAIASPQHPWLSMGLNSQYKNTRYSEAEMIEIWDRLTGSLRYRPGAF